MLSFCNACNRKKKSQRLIWCLTIQSSIWTCRILSRYLLWFCQLRLPKVKKNKYSKSDASKSMSYQGHYSSHHKLNQKSVLWNLFFPQIIQTLVSCTSVCSKSEVMLLKVKRRTVQWPPTKKRPWLICRLLKPTPW